MRQIARNSGPGLASTLMVRRSTNVVPPAQSGSPGIGPASDQTVSSSDAPIASLIAWWLHRRYSDRLTAVQGVEDFIAWCVRNSEALFDAITYGIRSLLDALEVIFVQTPWMVIAS